MEGIAFIRKMAMRAPDLRRRPDPCRREPEPLREELPLCLPLDGRLSRPRCFREDCLFLVPPGLLDRDCDLDLDLFLRVPPGLLEADCALLGDGGRKLASCCRWQRSPYWHVPCMNFWQISGMQPGRICLGDLALGFALAFITRGEAERCGEPDRPPAREGLSLIHI